MRARAFLAAALVAVAAAALPCATAEGGTAERSLLAAMNGVRTARGLAPLRFDARLARAARAHSSDMVRRGYVAHGPFVVRIRSAGAHGRLFGENIAWGTGTLVTARSIVARWLASRPHRANLLRPGFRRVGVGIAYGTFLGYDEATVVTAAFAGT